MKRIFNLAAFAVLVIPCHAAITYIDTTSIRSLMGATTNEWDVFTDALNQPNLGDISNAGATLTQTTPGAFVTSGGNIYSPSTINTFLLQYSTAFPLSSTAGNVVLQLKTFGSILDYDSTTLTYTDSLGNSAVAAVYGFQNQAITITGGFGGSEDSVAYQWDLSGLDAVSFSIHFNAAASSLSLDKLALDTVPDSSPFIGLVSPIPEPSSALLLGVASTLILIKRRRVA